MLAIPFLFSGYILHSINKSYYDNSCKKWEGRSVSVNGALHNEPEFDNGKTRFILNVESIDGTAVREKRNIRIQATIYSNDPIADLKYGSVVNITGEIRIPPGRRNFGGFNYRKFLASRGISGTLSIQEKALTILGDNRASWLKETGISSGIILNTLNMSTPANSSSILAGMLIGYTAEMPEEMEEDFREQVFRMLWLFQVQTLHSYCTISLVFEKQALIPGGHQPWHFPVCCFMCLPLVWRLQ